MRSAIATLVLTTGFFVGVSAADDGIGTKGGALGHARLAILNKYPDAKFSFLNAPTIEHQGDGKWLVQEKAKLPLPSGGSVERLFTVRVQYAGNNQWQLIDLQSE